MNKKIENQLNQRLTHKQAIDTMVVIDGKVHTLTQSFGVIMGCDMTIKEIKKRMIAGGNEIRFAGSTATNMGHGLLFWDKKNNENIFVETDKNQLEKLMVNI